MSNLKFKPGQRVYVRNVRNASAVGYLGTWHKVCDYIANPEELRHDEKGTPLYHIVSDNGYYTWFYEDELSTNGEEPFLVNGRPARDY